MCKTPTIPFNRRHAFSMVCSSILGYFQIYINSCQKSRKKKFTFDRRAVFIRSFAPRLLSGHTVV